MFSRNYHSELSYVRELCRQYAEENPNAASLLGERGADPDVERLLEGFAFLAARVRERVDDEVPEIVHELCERTAPLHLRTLPACSVVEFRADADALRSRRRIDAGSQVEAKPVDGTACSFRTTAPFDLLPLTLEQARIDAPLSSAPALRLQFRLAGDSEREAVFQPQGIRLYLGGDYAVASTLWLWLFRHCRRLEVRSLSGEGAVTLPPTALFAAGFAPELPLLPWPGRAPPGFRLLLEYFALAQKLLFVDVRGLDAARPAAAGQFEIAAFFDRPPALPGPVNKDNFVLNCTPVINLFSAEAQPIETRASCSDYPLVVHGLPAEHAEVYTVDSVRGRPRGSDPGLEYLPYFGVERAEHPLTEKGSYRLRRRISTTRDGLDAYLSIGDFNTGVPSDGEKLSLALTCTNRSLAGRLRLGDIAQEASSKTSRVGYRNLCEVTKPVLPPLGSEVLWRLAGSRALSSVQRVEDLRAALTLHGFQLGKDAGARRAAIDALRSLESGRKRRILEGVLSRGVALEVCAEESGFASVGDAALFGAALDEFLAAHLTFNSFSELVLRLEPSGKELAYGPTVGSQRVI